MKVMIVAPFMALLAVAVAGCAKPEHTVTGAAAARIAYIVSQHSPDLAADVKTRISQDFNGAPIDGKPGTHTIALDNAVCVSAVENQVACTLHFAGGKTVQVTGQDATELHSAMGQAGIVTELSDGSAPSRTSNALKCTVDDAIAQSTPASGDAVAGISCRFTE